MIRNYTASDGASLLRLWNTLGVKAGYAPLEQTQFRRLLLEHPDFSPEYTFVLEEEGQVLGFVNGCTGDHIPRGDLRGYVCSFRTRRRKTRRFCWEPWRTPSAGQAEPRAP